MTGAVINLIAGLGVCQGVVLLVALYRARRFNPEGFFFLMVALAAGWAILIEEWMVHLELWRQFPHIVRLTTWMPFLIGPGLWLFARSLNGVVRYRHDALHFIPALIALLYFLPFYLRSGPDKLAFILGTSDIPIDVSIFGAAKAVSLTGYLLATLVWLRRAPSSRLATIFIWLVAGFLGFTILVAGSFLVEHLVPDLPISSDLLSVLALSAFLYAVSLTVLVEWRSFLGSGTFTAALNAPSAPEQRKTYLLDKATTHSLFRMVEKTVRERRLYERPAMGLGELAKEVGLPEHYLSFVINTEAGKNMRAWLNGFRVEQACTALLDRPDDGVLDIALACGFNSKAAFNRSFQAETGMSPRDYRTSHLAK